MNAITAWATELKQIRERVLNDRITSLEDPRAQQLIESEHYPMNDGGAVLAQYFGDEDHTLEHLWFWHFTELPACPIPKPHWADTHDVLLGEWPEITIERNRTVSAGNFSVKVDDLVTVFAEPKTWSDGISFQPGDVLEDSGPPRLAISYGDTTKDFQIADLQELGILGKAILDLSLQISAEEVSNVDNGS